MQCLCHQFPTAKAILRSCLALAVEPSPFDNPLHNGLMNANDACTRLAESGKLTPAQRKAYSEALAKYAQKMTQDGQADLARRARAMANELAGNGPTPTAAFAEHLDFLKGAALESHLDRTLKPKGQRIPFGKKPGDKI
jgi:polyhydroxyalkanoate synthesis regulator phasin